MKPVVELLETKSEVRERVVKHNQVNKLNNKEKQKVMEARLDRLESKAANMIISNVSVARSAEDAAKEVLFNKLRINSSLVSIKKNSCVEHFQQFEAHYPCRVYGGEYGECGVQKY